MVEQKLDHEGEEIDSQSPQVFGISKENGSFRFSRRDFVRASVVASTVIALTGCKTENSSSGSNQIKNSSIMTDSPENLATEIPMDTNTPVPTATDIPTSTITPTSTPEPIIGSVKAQGINLRKGPGTNYSSIGTLSAKLQVIVIAQTSDGKWVLVRVKVSDIPSLAKSPLAQKGADSTVEGWIRADLLTYNSANMQDLPVKSAPPTPTALPNEKPTGEEGIKYSYTDEYGKTTSYTLSCGSPIPEGAVCTCNCVAVCSCNGYTAPSCSCVADKGDMVCTCDVVSYWYPN